MGLDLSAVPDEVVQRYGLDRLPLARDEAAAAALLRLDGKRALVTGGGGDGLGAAICTRLAEQGANVAVLDISAEAADVTVASIRDRWSVRAEPVLADVGDEAQVRAAADALAERWGGSTSSSTTLAAPARWAPAAAASPSTGRSRTWLTTTCTPSCE